MWVASAGLLRSPDDLFCERLNRVIDDAATVLGNDSAGALVCDSWRMYRCQ